MFSNDLSNQLPTEWAIGDMAASEQNLTNTTYSPQLNFITPSLTQDPNMFMTSPYFGFNQESSAAPFDYDLSSQAQMSPQETRHPSSSPPPTSGLNQDFVKLKPGRKRKDEVVDREALRKDRMIRNRMAAQRSRERKRMETVSVEQENKKLKQRNQELETRVNNLESSNQALLERLDALSKQMQSVQSQMQGQLQFDQMSRLLFNGFGETAVLDDRGLYRLRSQQRKPLNQVLRHRFIMLLAFKQVAQLYFLMFWTTHMLATMSISNGIPLSLFLYSFLNKFGSPSDFSSDQYEELKKTLDKAIALVPKDFSDVDLYSEEEFARCKWLPP